MPVIETFIEGNIPNVQKSAIAIKAAMKSDSNDENVSTSYSGDDGLYNTLKFNGDVAQSYYNKIYNNDENQNQKLVQVEEEDKEKKENDIDNSSWWKSAAQWTWIIGIIIICIICAYIIFSKRIRVNVRIFNNSAKKAGKVLRAGRRRLMNLF